MSALGDIVWRKARLARRQSEQEERYAHQSALGRLVVPNVPAWREETRFCEACGRALLVGERPLVVSRGDELLLACPLCQDRLLAEGCTRVALGPSIGAESSLVHVNEQERLAV